MDLINIKKKRVLVTGGCGYLGKRLVNNLVKLGANVCSIDILSETNCPEVLYYQIDLNNKSLLTEKILEINPDIIYHLAASLDRTRDFSKVNNLIEINLSGTTNLLNALRDISYENFVLISTSEVYGGYKISTPIKENTDFIPASPYSLSKYCAEMALKTYSNIYLKNYTILRVFNFFGQNMPQSFFLPQLISKLERNEDFEMTHGAQKRDFLHVDDIIEAMMLASISKAYNQVFNVCSGNAITIKELAIQFKTHLNSKSKIHFGAIPYRKNEIWDMTGDNSKIESALGWRRKFTVFKDYEKNDNEAET